MAAGSAFDPSNWKKAIVGVAVAVGAATGIAWWTAYTPGSGGTNPGAAYTANLYIAPSGGNDSCTRSSSPITYANAAGHICATFQGAITAATAGDTIGVKSGAYTYFTSAPSNDVEITTNKAVTFSCADGSSSAVTFSAAHFAIVFGGGGMTFNGGGTSTSDGCFHFNVVNIGYGGDSRVDDSVTMNGVKLLNFNCAGCTNLTIENSDIGNSVYCLGPSSVGVTAENECDATKPGEDYWATQSTGTDSVNGDYVNKIHDNGTTGASNVNILYNHIHGYNSRNPGTHIGGGIMLGNTNTVVYRGNVFDHNNVYDLQFCAGGTDKCNNLNWTIENNVFGETVTTFTNADGGVAGGGQPVTTTHEVGFVDEGASNNFLVRFNSFANGPILYGQTASANARFIGNIMGTVAAEEPCSGTDGTFGTTYLANWTVNYNVGAQTSCGTNWTQITNPYNNQTGYDFTLISVTTAKAYVPTGCGTANADCNENVDINQAARTYPTNAGAYGP